MSSVAEPTELEVGRIRELSKSGRHSEALSAAEKLSAASPHSRDALYLIAANQRCLMQIHEALATLLRLEQHYPRFSLLHQERGYCYTSLRDAPRAIEAFSQAVKLNPALAASWTMLEQLYRIAGEEDGRAMAAAQVGILQQIPSEVVRAGSLFSDGDLLAAENILRVYVLNGGNHVEGLRLLARIEHGRNALDDAEQRLEAALNLAPEYWAARLDYVRVLLDQQKYPQARQVIDAMRQAGSPLSPRTKRPALHGIEREIEPDDRHLLSLDAAACAGLGRHEAATEMYRRLLASEPESPELHMALGHSLRSLGTQNEAISSYRKAIAIRPGFGDAYWSLANLKTFRFSLEEVSAMRAQEAAPDAQLVDRYHLCFALGKAYEDQKEFQESWQFYERGNALKRAETHYLPEMAEANARKQIEVCTTEFFAARAGAGAPDADPIFIVGLPRSGSTLIEQILASHSQVDATRELPHIPRIARGLDGSSSSPASPHLSNLRYPDILANLDFEDFRSLGEQYLTDTRAYRGGNPFFIDKMPNNFRHIGLIHLMLPNAKIIDVRREPMACCFSNLKQLFASGQEFTYSIEDIARYYKSYLELMEHWDAVLPGQILHVCYEDIVEDLAGNVRRILKFCGLEFEQACVEFYKADRSINSASSEQVRQPIFRDALFQWRNYEPFLGPLKAALSDLL
jgi:tetratricopeptide (TPR) repeat protein